MRRDVDPALSVYSHCVRLEPAPASEAGSAFQPVLASRDGLRLDAGGHERDESIARSGGLLYNLQHVLDAQGRP